MTMTKETTAIHPDEVFEALLAKGGRSQRRDNLTTLHEICRTHHVTGSRDFGIATIGRLCETQGMLKGRALYNAASADYRTLIAAWATYAGPPTPKAPKVLASHDYLMRIEDPAIRAIMQAIISERDKLKAQINTLKAHANVTIDRRPLGASISTDLITRTVAILEPSAQLTASEREALAKAVSPSFLAEQGWREGSHGEILNNHNRALFDVGFASAIRRLLGS
jgi:hypothetical protein